MAWLSSATESIVESKKYITERLSVLLGSASYWKRTRTVTVTRWPGLTQAAAETKALSESAVADCTDAHTEATGGGSYAAVSTIDTTSDWERVEPV